MKLLTLLFTICTLLACSGDEGTPYFNNQTITANNGTQNNNGNNGGTTPANNGVTTPTNNQGSNNGTTVGNTTCVDTMVYSLDADGDGVAATDSPEEVKCLTTLEKANFITRNDDCNDGDPTQYPGAEGICGDHVVDTCDGDPPKMQGNALCQTLDEACPETQAGTIDEPMWDCTGDAPSNVYAYATFDNGNAYFKDDSCFIFFEGFKDGFYVKHKLDRVKTDASCGTAVGCVCPVSGSRSYDRRMYAFTSDPAVNNCPEIRLQDHACNEDLVQPVSNDCRKYLDQLHPFESNSSPAPFDHPYSYVAGSVEALELRLGHFKTLEVACVKNSNRGLDWASLMSGTIEINAGFVKK